MTRHIRILLSAVLAPAFAHAGQMGHEEIVVEAPFEMPAIRVPVFPERDFAIDDYGAEEGGKSKVTDSIRKAVQACHDAGGGRVVVPKGRWLTGAVHLRGNVNLHLTEGAELVFSDDPDDYLPAVRTSWEGMECFNYSPLVYAYDCENLAVTGKGTLHAKMGTWEKWSGRPPAHMEALKKLYHMAAKDVPVEQRRMAEGANNLRPHFIQFNRCRNVLVEDVRIRNSPFWTIHPLLCKSVVIRRVDVRAHGHNNDGVDPEMTRDMLVEDCVFDQGDDAIAIKSGRNQDAWRLDTPTENLVIRNCTMEQGHQLVAIGSELSGGIRNVYIHDCIFAANEKHPPQNMLFIKTNIRRGGFVENFHFENIEAEQVRYSVLGIETDVLYQWKDIVPTYEERLTPIRDIFLRNVKVGKCDTPFRILGDKRQPVTGVTLEDITVGHAEHPGSRFEHVRGLRRTNVTIGGAEQARAR
ncbi:MAG: glycoside hydrolase family 28 protein [Akkermansiaceae bacterium]|nr:glycoside hydrolase family 28 protein [Akkermansiaceae bacterium]